jgi:hypothetical protein
MTDIVRVWGSCDKIQVEFKYEGGKQWSCTVPPDLKDGIYVAEFWAQDDQGRIGHWTGFLYMVNGICHFKFNQERYQIWLHPNKYNFEFKKEDSRGTYFLDIQPFLYEINIEESQYKFGFEIKTYEAHFYIDEFCFDYGQNEFSFEYLEEENNYAIKNQYSFDIDNNYEIFFEKRCEHWEP